MIYREVGWQLSMLQQAQQWTSTVQVNISIESVLIINKILLFFVCQIIERCLSWCKLKQRWITQFIF